MATHFVLRSGEVSELPLCSQGEVVAHGVSHAQTEFPRCLEIVVHLCSVVVDIAFVLAVHIVEIEDGAVDIVHRIPYWGLHTQTDAERRLLNRTQHCAKLHINTITVGVVHGSNSVTQTVNTHFLVVGVTTVVDVVETHRSSEEHLVADVEGHSHIHLVLTSELRFLQQCLIGGYTFVTQEITIVIKRGIGGTSMNQVAILTELRVSKVTDTIESIIVSILKVVTKLRNLEGLGEYAVEMGYVRVEIIKIIMFLLEIHTIVHTQ